MAIVHHIAALSNTFFSKNQMWRAAGQYCDLYAKGCIVKNLWILCMFAVII